MILDSYTDLEARAKSIRGARVTFYRASEFPNVIKLDPKRQSRVRVRIRNKRTSLRRT